MNYVIIFIWFSLILVIFIKGFNKYNNCCICVIGSLFWVFREKFLYFFFGKELFLFENYILLDYVVVLEFF